MTKFNLSEWALKHQPLVRYFVIVLALIGIWSYGKLGQSEDPPFTFKIMTIRTQWPGASAHEVMEQVTDKIEKKLQEVPNIDFLRSYSRPGESQIFFFVKDSAPAAAVPEAHYQVRKRVGDIRQTLPAGIQGPFFNDEFGDTFGNIFALSGDGYSYADLKVYADRLRRELLRVPDVAKVDIIGEQEEKIYIEISNTKIGTLGVNPADILQALQQQNAVQPAGAFETLSDKVYVRVTGALNSIEEIRNFPIRSGNRTFRLGELGEVKRGYADPPFSRMRFMGKEAIGLGISMRQGGDIIVLGRNLDKAIDQLETTLPVGLDLHRVNDQPRAVSNSVNEFVRSLAEAVVIVLAVCFFSLKWRAGLVVALSIPLVLAVTFACMWYFDIGLHKISLGALILALGLLVDDAIIAVEMMAIKMEQGFDRFKAASFAYTSTAFPMLTGTLVTAAGFLPIATAKSGTGEYTRALFQVTTLALLISWFAAVILIPYLGYRLLPKPKAHAHTEDGIDEHGVYNTGFYRRFRSMVEWCVTWRKTVILITIVIFIGTMASFRLLQQQFFPSSTRVELLVDLKLQEGASFQATQTQVQKLEKFLNRKKDLFGNYVAYVGTGSPRFYFPLEQQLPAASFAQFVVTTNSVKAREQLRSELLTLFNTDFTELRGRVQRLNNGPPVSFPVMFRVTGEDIVQIRKIADQVADVMRQNTALTNVNFDWNEKSKIIRVQVDQDKARVLGVSSQELAQVIGTALNGAQATFFRERDKLIEVLIRGPQEERAAISLAESLAVPTKSGKSVPLTQFGKVTYEFEDGIIWRRDRTPTITVRADMATDALQPATVTAQVDPLLNPIRATLPPGYRIDVDGAVAESAKGQNSINAGMPLFAFVVVTVLMLQLMSFQRVLIVILTAPLGLIGVVWFLLAFNKPFGFVAMLGTIALFGMIMRNSVILIDQIDQDIQAGSTAFEAIIEATVRRFRPITLTAAAAILAMIPLTRSDFFGPMAVAIMGGLIVATLLTLAFLPALYAAWFRVKKSAVMA